MDDRITITIPVRHIGLISEVITKHLKSEVPETNHDAEMLLEIKQIQKYLHKILDIQLLKLQN